ncbi:Pre-mRNA-splicing factor sap61 [Wallemia ichthyophaga EXF-994]|uniref:Pre-mRNA-splicing factor sap61 n=1 Tax=Wallemia ichthyophaga (strain EXF-994 / CBS 113033) TaxID=1299270 RepID=R9AB36_WALI9|nr:Pre-mRNA-splicing factor sap61 [Wallemia ichthyophaga EXF-994]EOQ99327.1 Pre-mRNA-splicing factor sap61 [Wallemia ichthyophaga EXF-994]
MNTVIEDERNAHAEIDKYEDYLVELFLDTAKGQKKQMAQKHQMSKITSRMIARREFLKKSYKSNEREEELTIIGTSQVADDLNGFYDRLSSIKDYHRNNPNTPIDPFAMELDGFTEELDNDAISSVFSGEEAYGKYLDLHLPHEQYINLKNIPKRLNYLEFLDDYEQVEDLPLLVKRQSSYADYLNSLVSYLESFLHRSRPLDDYSAIQADALSKFDEQWKSGTAPGWSKQEDESVEQGIWDPVMQRTYTNVNVYNNVKKSKKYQNALKRLEQSGESTQPSSADSHTPPHTHGDKLSLLRKSKDRTLASQEALIRLYATILAGVRKDTKAEVERKSALTAREREQELEEAEYEEYKANPMEQVVEEEKDDEGKIYNPLKLPLGWDGKPIPFWLFKLHGLGVEYECEICSGKVYNGRKNFEKHFQEGTHAYGMRALGLPNTKHFHEITKIADALALAEKLKLQGRQESQASATVEEMEDDQGNVYDIKTYNQLKKQGLL